MTKDRRLGRGLAALLGTPLEEDGVLESAGTVVVDQRATDSGKLNSAKLATAANSGIATNRSSESSGDSRAEVSSSLSNSQRNEAYEKSNSSALKSASPKLSPSESTSGEGVTRQRVTGSVPLSGRSSSTGSGVTGSAVANVDAGDKINDEHNTTLIRSIEINVSDIENNPFQPRRRFNETEIASLAESIREHQQLQPILVRRVGKGYQLISGERRLRATIHAGFTKIRAEVREADDRLVAELAIVENLQRKDLDAIEKAMSFRRYIDEHNCLQEDLAKRLKIDRSTIANLMRLLELPQELQVHIQNGKLSSGHARTLLPLGHEEEQIKFARWIMDEGWTVRETERRVAAHLLEQDGQNKPRPNASRSGPRKRDTPHLATLELQIRQSLGTKAEIRQQKSGRGKIVINFNNSEEFERLFALICSQSAKRAA